MYDASFSRGDNHEYIKCDRAAYQRPAGYYGGASRNLYAGSFIGTETQVKAVRAMLHSSTRPSLQIDRQYFTLQECGYDIQIAKFPLYKTCHMTIRAKEQRLLIGKMSEVVHSYLLSDAIDSPILAEWVPFITKTLDAHDKIIPLDTIGEIPAYLARFTSRVVDEVISLGLAEGDIEIPSSRKAAPEVALNSAL